MQQLRSLSDRVRFSEKAVPVIFLAVLFLAFGLVISALGIYQDDWLFVYNAYIRGPQGLWEFLYADGTPFSSLMNTALFYLLGVKPLYWHIAALIARWLTVVAFWLLFRQLWPTNPLQNFLAAILFAVYPFFNLQPLAFTYLHIWIAFASLGFSFYWMILAIRSPGKFWLYYVLSVIAGAITGLTLEYFMGLEFILRPIILWFALRDYQKTGRQRMIRVVQLWLPYLFLFGIYFWWRFFIYQVPIATRNDPVGLQLLLSDPIAEIGIILSNIVPDILYIVVAAWYRVLDPLFFDLTERSHFLFTLLSVVAGAAVFLVFDHYTPKETTDDGRQTVWHRQALLFGLIIVIVGLIPPYVGGLFINEKNPLWNSRFGLASMPGAALIVVAFLESISPKLRTRLVLIAVLIGLSVGYHARYMNDYRGAWKKEANLFRQLKLRIPALQPGTAIVADQEILYYMGDYPTAYAINALYSQPLADKDQSVDYWFFSITTNFGNHVSEFLQGMDIEAAHRSIRFVGRSDQTIIVSFDPFMGQCLYVLRPQEPSFRQFSPLLEKASHLSALDRIATSADPSSSFLHEIGMNYPEDWCTYYQKADLARQNGKYQEVLQLWSDAHKNGFAPGAYFEYFPFLDASTQLGRWDQSAQLTLEAIRSFPAARPAMCDYWSSLQATAEKDLTFDKLKAKLRCVSGD